MWYERNELRLSVVMGSWEPGVAMDSLEPSPSIVAVAEREVAVVSQGKNARKHVGTKKKKKKKKIRKKEKEKGQTTRHVEAKEAAGRRTNF